MATRARPQPTASTRDDDPTSVAQVVGRRLHQFRTELGLSLRSLAELSGLSIGFLSQLERGRTSIGLTTLHSLAERLGRDLTDFFDESIQVPPGSNGEATPAPSNGPTTFTLVRAGDRVPSEYSLPEISYQMLSHRAPGLILEPMIVRIAPGRRVSGLESHDGEEFAYVLSGELCYVVDGTTHRLQQGDSLHLKSATPHSLYNDTDDVTVVVSVVTPRLF